MSSVAGVDIGSDSIKSVVLRQAKNGPVEVLAAGTLALGELGHIENATDRTLAIGEKLKELVRSARIRADVRRVGCSGSDASVRYLQVPPVPPWRLDMLVKYEVEEKGGEHDAQTFDYRILDVPEVGGQYTVMIGALKESAASDILAMGRGAGLGEVQIDLEVLALYNAYYHGHGFDADKTVLVVDMGADDITVLVVKNGALYYGRTILGGGRRFTQVLSEELKIDPLEAEEIKKNQAQILFDLVAPGAGRTGRMLRPGLTGIIPRTPGLSAARAASAASAAVPSGGGSSEAAAREIKMPSDTVKIEVPPPLDELVLIPGNPGAEGTGGSAVEANADLPPSLEALDLSIGAAPAKAPAAPTSGNSTLLDPSPLASTLTPNDPPTALMNMNAPALDLNDDKRRRQISAALVKEAAALCAAIENAVMICRQQNKLRELKVDRIYLTGGASRLKGLSEFMNRRMRLEVAPLEPLRQISLDRLPPEQAAALKAEQHLLAVAAGLGLSELDKKAFSFLLWPEALKQRKIFWSRGAYLGYAAALAALALGLFLYTPHRNREALAENDARASKAVEVAQAETKSLNALTEENKEKHQRYKQIHDNTNSGHYFLNLLSELKDPSRIPPDIILTSISTTMPAVMRVGKENEAGAADTGKPLSAKEKMARAVREDTGPDTFQAQRRIYIRGFARSGDKVKLLDKIEAFKNALVPKIETPDSPENLFKDIRTVWWNPEDQQQSSFALKEFVLEAYTERTGKESSPAAAAPARLVAKEGATTVSGRPAGGAAQAKPASGTPEGSQPPGPKYVLPSGKQ